MAFSIARLSIIMTPSDDSFDRNKSNSTIIYNRDNERTQVLYTLDVTIRDICHNKHEHTSISEKTLSKIDTFIPSSATTVMTDRPNRSEFSDRKRHRDDNAKKRTDYDRGEENFV